MLSTELLKLQENVFLSMSQKLTSVCNTTVDTHAQISLLNSLLVDISFPSRAAKECKWSYHIIVWDYSHMPQCACQSLSMWLKVIATLYVVITRHGGSAFCSWFDSYCRLHVVNIIMSCNCIIKNCSTSHHIILFI